VGTMIFALMFSFILFNVSGSLIINSKIIVPTIEQEAYQYFEIYNRMFGIA